MHFFFNYAADKLEAQDKIINCSATLCLHDNPENKEAGMKTNFLSRLLLLKYHIMTDHLHVVTAKSIFEHVKFICIEKRVHFFASP